MGTADIKVAFMGVRTVRTTISLPEELLHRADRVVREGAAKSRNELLASALSHEIESLERREIDEAFARMAEDEEYLEEAESLAEQLAGSEQEPMWGSEERG